MILEWVSEWVKVIYYRLLLVASYVMLLTSWQVRMYLGLIQLMKFKKETFWKRYSQRISFLSHYH